jgi:large subunit ribosomal protein L23
MALFGNKKPARTTDAVQSGGEKGSVGVARDLAHVLSHARITEKATDNSMRNVYVFNVSTRATKRDIMQAVRKLYSVTPLKVAVVTIRRKSIRNMRTGRTGVKGGGKKAYVYLKKGDSITIS